MTSRQVPGSCDETLVGSCPPAYPAAWRRRRRPLRALACSLAAVLCLVVAPAAAPAADNVYTIFHFDLFTTTTTFPGGPYTHSGQGGERFNWTVDTAHSTRVSINWCSSYDLFDAVDIAAHDQGERYFTADVGWFPGDCIRFRGRSLYGTQYNRNGTLRI